jgi:hypothetical protein
VNEEGAGVKAVLEKVLVSTWFFSVATKFFFIDVSSQLSYFQLHVRLQLGFSVANVVATEIFYSLLFIYLLS